MQNFYVINDKICKYPPKNVIWTINSCDKTALIRMQNDSVFSVSHNISFQFPFWFRYLKVDSADVIKFTAVLSFHSASTNLIHFTVCRQSYLFKFHSISIAYPDSPTVRSEFCHCKIELSVNHSWFSIYFKQVNLSWWWLPSRSITNSTAIG